MTSKTRTRARAALYALLPWAALLVLAVLTLHTMATGHAVLMLMACAYVLGLVDHHHAADRFADFRTRAAEWWAEATADDDADDVDELEDDDAEDAEDDRPTAHVGPTLNGTAPSLFPEGKKPDRGGWL